MHKRFVEQPRPDYRLVQATPKENIHLPPDFYDQLKEAYAERFYRQEALGEYLDVFGGNAYYAFSEDNITTSKCVSRQATHLRAGSGFPRSRSRNGCLSDDSRSPFDHRAQTASTGWGLSRTFSHKDADTRLPVSSHWAEFGCRLYLAIL